MELRNIVLQVICIIFIFLPNKLESLSDDAVTAFQHQRTIRQIDAIAGFSTPPYYEKPIRNQKLRSSINVRTTRSTEGEVPLDSRPYFDMSYSKNITTLVGQTAHLNCRVLDLGNKSVSWVRHSDIHLLTNGRDTYSSDLRFQTLHNPETGDWTLQIKFPQRRDSGTYECQISTTPPIGHAMYLSVVEPLTSIIGAPDLYINTGSTVNLTCIVRHLPEPPASIVWKHNNNEIGYDSPRGGVSVITEKGEITISNLLIQRARSSDSGKYYCVPSSANPQVINVHILNGEHPEAMQHGGQLKLAEPWHVVLLIIFCLIVG